MKREELQHLADGLEPVIRQIIEENVQTLADVIVAQGKTISTQAERIALLEHGAGYETIGTDKAGKPRLRAIARKAA